MKWRLGVDVGGTFTDVALVNEQDGRIGIAKVLSTPEDIAKGVLEAIRQGLAKSEVEPSAVSLLSHGTTVVTNALLEAKGAKAAFITTRGFGDVLELRRSARASLYDLFQDGPSLLIPRRWCYEVSERLDSSGNIVTPIAENDVDAIIDELRRSRIQTVAVSFLFSFLNDAHEKLVRRKIAAALPQVQVFLSSEVLPEIREFERASTTAVCAYVAPILKGYLERLEAAVTQMGLPAPYVMGSSGGMVDIAETLRMPALIVESGPAAGVIASAQVGKQLTVPNAISFDMGGTTAKASLIHNGTISTTAEYEVGGSSHMSRALLGTGQPIRVQVIDIAEVSSGGGSIVSIDPGGALKVGPQSAGAVPGPACYGRGGTKPTVTDANVVLGYLDRAALLAGSLKIDYEAAVEAINDVVAQPLGISVPEAAWRVIEVVNSSMAEALRIVSVERGHDAREFSLISFGGAGPVHAAALADELQIPEIIVPPAPGAFSAIGLVASDLRRDYSRSLYMDLKAVTQEMIQEALGILEKEANQMFDAARVPQHQRSLLRSADVRYRRQAYELTVPIEPGLIGSTTAGELAGAFHSKHHQTYGHADESEPVQLVNLRITAVGKFPPIRIRQKATPSKKPWKSREIWIPGFGYQMCEVFWRDALKPGTKVHGLSVIEAMDSTIVVPKEWSAVVDEDCFIRMGRT